MTTKYKDTGINHFEDDNKLTALFSSLHCNCNMWQMGDRREEGRGVVENSVKRQYSFSARTAKKKALQVQIFLTRSLHLLCEQGCIFRLMCSYPELTVDHVLTSAYVKIFRTITRNAVNKSVWRKKYCFWHSLNKHAMNIWLSSLRIRAHLSWRTGKHLHVLHLLRTYSTYSYPGY